MLVYLNKIKFSHILILIICLLNCSDIIENRIFNHKAKDFLNEYFQAFPVQATLMGNHDYDHQLDNFSKENIDKIVRFLKLTTENIARIDTNKLSSHNKINFRILALQLKLQLFELEQWKRWQKDATFYIQKIDDAVYGLKIYRSDTTENRTQNLIARLDQVPDLLSEAKKNLQSSDIVNLSLAIDRIDNLNRAIAFQLSNQFLVTGTLVDSFNQKSEIVVDSLESFKDFLESKLNTYNNHALPMTAENYQVYVSLMIDKKIKLEELANSLEANYQKYYGEILDIVQVVLHEAKKRNVLATGINSIEAVYDEIQKQSLAKDKIIPFCFETINDVKRFIDEIWNLALPIDYDIQINWANNDQFPGLKLAEFEKPGLLDPIIQFHCHLKPILNDRDWLQQLSQLRDYNKPALTAIMMLEATPIHYHTWRTKLNDFPVLVMAFPDRILLNAWQYYFAFSLLKTGFQGYDPEVKYMLLRDYLRNVLLAKAEIQYYTQQLSSRQLERMLLESKLFKKNELEKILKHINYSHGQALVNFWGFKRLKELEHACRTNSGAHFSFQEFLQYILAQGPIAIELIQHNVVKELIFKNDN
jgi:hypothetical protein